MFKFVVFIAFLAVAAANPVTRSDSQSNVVKPFSGTSNVPQPLLIELEEFCVRQGGLCQLKEDCPPSNKIFMGGVLCPKQRAMGVECCYL